jgi:hypothetical protein
MGRLTGQQGEGQQQAGDEDHLDGELEGESLLAQGGEAADDENV